MEERNKSTRNQSSRELVRGVPSYPELAGAHLPSKADLKSRPDQDPNLIACEILNHLVAHGGPDNRGRAHPDPQTVVPYEALELALSEARAHYVRSEFLPVHFKDSLDTFQVLRVVNEQLLILGDKLLEQRQGDLGRFIAETTKKEFSRDVLITISGHVNTIRGKELLKAFNGDALQLLKHYLVLKGYSELAAGIQKYHRGMLDEASLQSLATRRKLLLLQGDRLLLRFGGSLGDMISCASTDDWKDSAIDVVAGVAIPVKMTGLVTHFNSSTFELTRAYLLEKGHLRIAHSLGRHHMARPGSGTFDDPALVQELRKKKAIEVFELFGCKPAEFVNHCEMYHWSRPLTETVAGIELKTNMAQVFKGWRMTELLKFGLEVAGRPDLSAALKPWFLSCVPRSRTHKHTLLKAKGNQLIREHGGSPDCLLTDVQAGHWLQPLRQKFGEGCLFIPTEDALREFGSNQADVTRYFYLAIGRPDLSAKITDSTFS